MFFTGLCDLRSLSFGVFICSRHNNAVTHRVMARRIKYYLTLSMACSRCFIFFISTYLFLSAVILLADLILSSYLPTRYLFYLGSLEQ